MCEYCSSFFTRTQEPYQFLLERKEWQAKRLRILARDNYKCQMCGAHEGKEVHLHVHHLHYIVGLDPWEYKDSELVTLCEKCHNAYHSRHKVPVYHLNGENLVELKMTPCTRCGGAGRFPQYKHVLNGICFRCHGAKYNEQIYVVEKYAKEHDIDLDDINDGFSILNPKVEGLGTITKAAVESCRNREGVYCKLIFDDGRIASTCLDYSVNARPGDKLDPNKLKYRNATKKNGEQYVIIKGPVLRISA